jgi:hypothetical protein
MKKRVTPQEKKRLAYERDHYVSAGESRHAFRKNWPKKKAMVNQIHRHRAAEALHTLERLGGSGSIEDSTIEVTAEQLRKSDPRKKLHKSGVQSLRKYVERNQSKREERARQTIKERARIKTRYETLIRALERNIKSPTAQELLREIKLNNWHLRLFLRWNPEWIPRLKQKFREVKRLEENAEMRRQQKEAEKQRTKMLRESIQTHVTVR